MTHEEYSFYTTKAHQIFDFINSRINTTNRFCTLITDAYDHVNKTYGNIVYPINVYVHIGNAVDDWREEFGTIMRKEDFVCTIISWTIAHELHHADQTISMLRYNLDEKYRIKVEMDVERASYNWVCDHAAEISQACGFNVVIDLLTSKSMPEVSEYRRVNTKTFYLQTIANIIIRDFSIFDSLRVFDDGICSDIIIVFNNSESIVIKSHDRYLNENVEQFCRLVNKYCSVYDRYGIRSEATMSQTSDGRRMATIHFIIHDAMTFPIIFADR